MALLLDEGFIYSSCFGYTIFSMHYTKKILSGLGFLFGVGILTGLAYVFTTYGALNIPRKSNIVISATSTLPFTFPAVSVTEF